jgi:hypothetical protein
MRYAEVKKEVENMEMSLRMEKDFSKLSEDSTQAEVDRFCRKYDIKEMSEEEKAYNRCLQLLSELDAVKRINAQSGETSVNDILALESADYNLSSSEIVAELHQLAPAAIGWAEFVNEPSATSAIRCFI